MATRRSPRTPPLVPEPVRPEKSLGQLVGEMTSEPGTLMRKEVQLAKVELSDEVRRAGTAGGLLGAGAMTGYFAVLSASLALARLLDQAMNRAPAFCPWLWPTPPPPPCSWGGARNASARSTRYPGRPSRPSRRTRRGRPGPPAVDEVRSTAVSGVEDVKDTARRSRRS